MCNFGDIIVIEKYIGEDGKKLSKHSFIVINDTPGQIEGLNYNLVTSVMSSFKNEKQRKNKLKYKENLEITSDDIKARRNNNKNGYIKADKLYYFDKTKLDYWKLGSIQRELLDELMLLIRKLDKEEKLTSITTNIEN